MVSQKYKIKYTKFFIDFKKDKSVNTIDLITFIFFGDDYTLNGSPWHTVGSDPLGNYHLQYMDVLNASSDFDTVLLQNFILRWIKENPDSKQLKPYTVSRRLVNWVKFFSRENIECSPIVQKSITIQYQFLMKNLEKHLMANHYFANLKALLFVQLHNQDANQSDIDATFKEILCELDQQVLNDSGHFELSPSYHANFLDDILDIYILITSMVKFQDYRLLIELQDKIKLIAPKMGHWLELMSHGDAIASFSDTSIEMTTSSEVLKKKLLALSLTSVEKSRGGYSNQITFLEDSGYVIFQSSKQKLILDCGEFGARVNPGHGHADIGSLELSCSGTKIITNGGTSSYHLITERLKSRSTANYSGYVSNGGSSSRLLGKFKVGKTAKILSRSLEVEKKRNKFLFSYRGFPKVGYSFEHKRMIEFMPDDIFISDRVVDKFGGTVQFLIVSDILISRSEKVCNFSVGLSNKYILTLESNCPIVIGKTLYFEDINRHKVIYKVLIPVQNAFTVNTKLRLSNK